MDETLPGKVIIAPEVIITIVKMTALATPGVARLSTSIPGRMTRLLRGAHSADGIDVEMQGDNVVVELFVVATREAKMRELGEQLQRDTSRAITEIVGLPVGAVNVHIEDVADPFDDPSSPADRAD
jgi:uncharacterized alkaline shock family protein YloU